MTREQHQTAKRVFFEVCEAAVQDRPRLLDELCGGDADVRAKVESLLRNDPGAEGGDLAPPSPEHVAAALEAHFGEGPGHRIGPYTLVRLIGEGGFGSVFLAEQHAPIRRQVAFKLIKPGMDSRQVVARFEQERQAMAQLDHPNIARIYDGGATPSGRPYFVMELCDGQPITTFCDRASMPVRDRIGLFLQVCRAVQHAHTKGLIHRDLKPSNVLVSETADGPCVKVIDFGIAKLAAAGRTDGALLTIQSQFLGTPEYMSPEQAESSPDIDTRSDVYSLGMLLYELISGTSPIASQVLRSASPAEFLRIVREVDPPVPSSRLLPIHPAAGEIAAARGTDIARLRALVRGDLDWITSKAIEKDRQRRYETTHDLAQDLERFLAGEPVYAAPPGTWYRSAKLVRRNRGLFAAGAALAAALLLGLAGTIWQAREARREALAARRAEESYKQVAEQESQARVEAQRLKAVAEAAEQAERTRADELRAVSEFQSEMFGRIDAMDTGERLMADLRDRYAAGLRRGGLTDAEVDSRLADFEGALRGINATDAAAQLIVRTMIEPALQAQRDRRASANPPSPTVEASLLETLSDLYSAIGRFSDELSLRRECLEIRRRTLGDGAADTLLTRLKIATALRVLGDFSGAERELSEVIPLMRSTLGPDHESTLTAIASLGSVKAVQREFGEAERLQREAYAGSLRSLPQDSLSATYILSNLSSTLQIVGKLDEAEPLMRELLTRSRRQLGETNVRTLIQTHNYARLLFEQKRLEEAEAEARYVVEKRLILLGKENPRTLNSMMLLGTVLHARGNLAEAERVLRTVAESFDRAQVRDGQRVTVRHVLGRTYTGLARYADAERELLRAEALRKKSNDTSEGNGRQIAESMVDLYTRWNQAQPNPDLAAKLELARASASQRVDNPAK